MKNLKDERQTLLTKLVKEIRHQEKRSKRKKMKKKNSHSSDSLFNEISTDVDYLMPKRNWLKNSVYTIS